MIGAINYVRRKGHYVMKYYQVVESPRRTFKRHVKWRKRSFHHLLFPPFADIVSSAHMT